MNNCLFCKIINHNIPAVTIYEDDKILAFLDISQTTRGHTLVIPKAHYENIFEIDEDTIAYLFRKIPNISKAITEAFNASGLNIVNNNNEAAGQTVFHFHIHLIPRYDDEDGFRLIYTNNMDKYSKEDLEVIASQIKEKLGN